MADIREDVLKIKHISVIFDGFRALTDVDITIKRNTIHFFIGPNGAGRRRCSISSAQRQSPRRERFIIIRRERSLSGSLE